MGTPLFNGFQLSARVCTEQKFSARLQQVLLFYHWVHHFLAFSAKCTSFCNSEFSARDQHVLSFPHWAHHFLAIFSKLHEIVQSSEFSKRSARFDIPALGKRLFSHEFVQNSVFLRTSARFVH